MSQVEEEGKGNTCCISALHLTQRLQLSPTSHLRIPTAWALPSRENPQFSDVLSLLPSLPRLPRYFLALPPPRLHLSVGTVSGAQSPRFCWWETRDRTKGRSHVPASRWSRGMGDNGRGLYTSDLSVEDSKPARASPECHCPKSVGPISALGRMTSMASASLAWNFPGCGKRVRHISCHR